jgi:ankyrin repeat protein
MPGRSINGWRGVAADLNEFLVAARSPIDGWHASGSLERANQLLSQHPGVAGDSILAAAALGDAGGIREHLRRDPELATTPGGPHGWDPLTTLCFSQYLRLDPSPADGFVESATLLLEAGANPSTGWWEPGHNPEPVWEGVLYGAAGVARHPALTRLLLEWGADPNDDEVAYHAPESYDNTVLEALVESGRLSPDSLATMLLRKHDWHDKDGVRYLLAHGADPNRMTRWGRTAFHQAVLRDNSAAIIELLLDHGADPSLTWNGRDAASLGARRGRGDLLASLARRGVLPELHGLDRLLAACALDDAVAVERIVHHEPLLVAALRAEGGDRLAEFAGVGNAGGVRQLLELGVSPMARYEGDGYWDVAARSTALHVAAWRARHEVVSLLLERGAEVDVPDGKGRTALALAVKACVDSHWADRRQPDSVAALLAAGASVVGVGFPSGYQQVDQLLQAAGAIQG